MKLEPGMRVRCVNPYPWKSLTKGAEYVIADAEGKYVRLVGMDCSGFNPERFKPIIRVKASTQRVISNGPFAGMTESDAIDLVRGGY